MTITIFLLYFLPAVVEASTWGRYMTVNGVTPIRILSALLCAFTPVLNLWMTLLTGFHVLRAIKGVLQA